MKVRVLGVDPAVSKAKLVFRHEPLDNSCDQGHFAASKAMISFLLAFFDEKSSEEGLKATKFPTDLRSQETGAQVSSSIISRDSPSMGPVVESTERKEFCLQWKFAGWKSGSEFLQDCED